LCVALIVIAAGIGFYILKEDGSAWSAKVRFASTAAATVSSMRMAELLRQIILQWRKFRMAVSHTEAPIHACAQHVFLQDVAGAGADPNPSSSLAARLVQQNRPIADIIM